MTLFTSFFLFLDGINSFEMYSDQNMDSDNVSPHMQLLWLSLETETWILPLRCPAVVISEQWFHWD